jgi:hypothetical protein
MAKRPAGAESGQNTSKPHKLDRPKVSETVIARAAGVLAPEPKQLGRDPADDDELLLQIGRLMASPTPPSSVAAAIEIVLAPFIEEGKGPKKDWVIRLHGTRLQYKGVESRLGGRYKRNAGTLQLRLAEVEAFRQRTEARIAAIVEVGIRQPRTVAPLGAVQLERLRAWKGALPLTDDLDRCAEILRSSVASQLAKKRSTPR